MKAYSDKPQSSFLRRCEGVPTLLSACFGCHNLTDENSLSPCFFSLWSLNKVIHDTLHVQYGHALHVQHGTRIYLYFPQVFYCVYFSFLFAAAGGTLQFPHWRIIETNSLPFCRWLCYQRKLHNIRYSSYWVLEKEIGAVFLFKKLKSVRRGVFQLVR